MRNKGFSVIELIVTLGLFGIIVIGIMTITFSIVGAQKKVIDLQKAQESSRYILELMSKEIRMSSINSDDSGGAWISSLSITNPQGENIVYQFNSDKVYRVPQGIPLGNDYLISPEGLEVNGAFYIQKNQLSLSGCDNSSH